MCCWLDEEVQFVWRIRDRDERDNLVIAGIASEVFYGTAKLVINMCKNSTTDAILLTEPRWIRDGYYGGEGAVCVCTCGWSTLRVGLQL